jgi:fucose permease
MALFTAMTICFLLATGMGVALLGSVKLSLAARLGIDEARVGGMVSVFGFTMIPVVLTAGFVTDFVGRPAVLLAGGSLMAASLVLLACARSYAVAFAAIVLLSGGWSALVNVVNVLTPIAFRGDEAFATNLANVFFGAGAFLTPLGVSALLRRYTLSQVLGLVAGLVAVPVGLSLGVDFTTLVASPGSAAAGSTAGWDTGRLVRDTVMWLCGFTLFFYGPLEASMAAWATTYLGDRGHSASRAARYLSAFWLAFMAARLGTAFGLPKGLEAPYLVGLAVAAFGVLCWIAQCRSAALAAGLVVAAGLVFGPIFPTLMAILLQHVPASAHGRAVGMLFAVGGIGWTLIPMALGAYASRVGVPRGFRVAAGAAAGLAAITALLANAWHRGVP